MDPRSIINENGGHAHWLAVHGKYILLVEWSGDERSLHLMHIKKVGVNWDDKMACNRPGPDKWSKNHYLDNNPRNFPIIGNTWEGYRPISGLVAHLPGCSFPTTLALLMSKAGDYVNQEGMPSTLYMHLLRADAIPKKFIDVFAQPVKGRGG